MPPPPSPVLVSSLARVSSIPLLPLFVVTLLVPVTHCAPDLSDLTQTTEFHTQSDSAHFPRALGTAGVASVLVATILICVFAHCWILLGKRQYRRKGQSDVKVEEGVERSFVGGMHPGAVPSLSAPTRAITISERTMGGKHSLRGINSNGVRSGPGVTGVRG
ncbi:hypothetical protein F4810DRAFT_705879 [Camillea tinctor]|nr:hypothetical protein F4810DRAFT_705879 [Camillea tinctor]